VEVAFLDVGAGYTELRGELDTALARVLASGWYVGGPEVEAFEAEFARFCDSAHCVGTGNGLDALTIALTAQGIGPGDEVIVPAHTFIATWLAVTRTGATVVPVDVEPEHLLIDPGAVADAITSRTAAIVPVHLSGDPVDPAPLDALSRRHGLFVLGDAAQAHGARFDGRDVGSLGDAAAFSFYPAKNLGAFGDGGAITTDDAALAERARRLRSYGARRDDRYRFDEPGVNSRLDPLQAAALRVKLSALGDWNGRRRRHADAYLKELEGTPDVTLPARASTGACHVYHLFCVRHPDRDRLAAHLAARAIATQIHYPEPPHLSGAFADLGFARGSFPVTEAACATLLSLPIGPHLSDAARELVVAGVRSFAHSASASS
jgi:dTDP-3-amino-3,4,6-trideoxy-alpha-D-glucose transaminase